MNFFFLSFIPCFSFYCTLKFLFVYQFRFHCFSELKKQKIQIMSRTNVKQNLDTRRVVGSKCII
jgi:hypothetical protein